VENPTPGPNRRQCRDALQTVRRNKEGMHGKEDSINSAVILVSN
jgi:hypothetical protein